MMEGEKGSNESSLNEGGRKRGLPMSSSSSSDSDFNNHSKRERKETETEVVVEALKNGNRTGVIVMNTSSSVPVLMKHPLEIPVVLVEVLRHLKRVEDLKSFREVNKLWRNESLGKWRNIAAFRLNEESEKALKLTLGLEVEESSIAADDGGAAASAPPEKKSIPTIYNFLEKPFKNYRLAGRYTFPPTLPALKDELFFWEYCGSFIEFLDIEKASVFKSGLQYEGLKWIFGTCPNLEEFKMIPYKQEYIGEEGEEEEENIGFVNFNDLEEEDRYVADSIARIVVAEAEAEASIENANEDEPKEDIVGEGEEEEDEDVEDLGEELEGEEDDEDDQEMEELEEEESQEEDEEGEDEDAEDASEEEEDDENDNEILIRETEIEAADLSLAANKLKSLTISASDIKNVYGRYVELFRDDLLLSLKLFKLTPNLKNFSLNTVSSFTELISALGKGAAGGKPVLLEKFTSNQDQEFFFEGSRLLLRLMEYLNKIESSSLKEMDLFLKGFRYEDGWVDIFREVLNKIKDQIQKISLTFSFTRRDYIPRDCRFNLFNYHFTELTSLNLKFQYVVGGMNRNSYDFDFAVFRGTPSLKYFNFEAIDLTPESNGSWLMAEKLTASDLKQGKGNNWVEYVNEEEEAAHNARGPAQGLLMMEEIALDDLKEFHFQGRFTPEAMEVLGKWMKNLEVIETIFDVENFKIPFELWRKSLKKVTVLKYSKGEEQEISEELISEQRMINAGVEIERKMIGQFEDGN